MAPQFNPGATRGAQTLPRSFLGGRSGSTASGVDAARFGLKAPVRPTFPQAARQQFPSGLRTDIEHRRGFGGLGQVFRRHDFDDEFEHHGYHGHGSHFSLNIGIGAGYYGAGYSYGHCGPVYRPFFSPYVCDYVRPAYFNPYVFPFACAPSLGLVYSPAYYPADYAAPFVVDQPILTQPTIIDSSPPVYDDGAVYEGDARGYDEYVRDNTYANPAPVGPPPVVVPVAPPQAQFSVRPATPRTDINPNPTQAQLDAELERDLRQRSVTPTPAPVTLQTAAPTGTPTPVVMTPKVAPATPPSDPARDKRFKEIDDLLKAGDEKFTQGKYKEARESYQRALALDRENPQLLLACGMAETALSNFHDAAAALHEVMGRQPDLGRLGLDIRPLFAGDDLTARTTELAQRVAANAKDADALLVLGFVQTFSGHPTEGRAAFSQYLAQRSDDQAVSRFVKELDSPATGGSNGK